MTLLQSNRGIFEGLADASHPRIHLDLVKKLLGRRILFHPVFVTITGSVTASLMLSQSLYWTRTWLTQPEQLLVNGWFWKSAKEWQDETGLSRREQETARKILREISFLEEKKQGMPAKSFYRIDLNQIANSIHPASEIDWGDDAIVFELLGSPISFHRCLVDFTDSATASLMLSHAIGLTAKILSKRPDGWFWKSVKEWQDETGLSRHEQEAARKMLREIGLISEKRTLANQTITNFKVDLDRLKSLLLQTHTTAPDSIGIATPESANLVCGKPANRSAGKRQPCMRETSKQERRKAPTLYAGNQQTGAPESANLGWRKAALQIAQNRLSYIQALLQVLQNHYNHARKRLSGRQVVVVLRIYSFQNNSTQFCATPSGKG